MKRFHWLTEMMSVRRLQAVRPRLAECLETRALMDATMPELVDAATGTDEPQSDGQGEVVTTEAEITTTSVDVENPEIFQTLGGAGEQTPEPITVSQFESREAFGEYLIQRALRQNEGLFGQPSWWYRGPVYYQGGDFVFAASANDSVVRSQSETNTQVAGVDEGDIIENDGTHLFVLSGQDLRIIKAFPADALEEVARVRIDGYAIAEYLDSDRLTVISQEYSFDDFSVTNSLTSRLFIRPSNATTIVSVFDVTDRANPSLAKQTRLDGSYVDSRAINGQVHVITSNYISLPIPQTDGTTTIETPIYRWVDEPVLMLDPVLSLDADDIRVASTESINEVITTEANGAAMLAGDAQVQLFRPTYEIEYETIEVPVYESRETYEARLRESIDALIDSALPNYFSVTAEGIAAEGLISEVESINRISTASSDNLLSIASIDMHAAQPGLMSASSVMADYTQGMYANAEHLYLFQPNYSFGDTRTTILEFSWANGEREIELIGTGIVEGTLLNQFSADEFDGRLRVATTVSGFDENFNWRTTNRLTVLENIAGTLTEVGAIDGFADDERIYSVRFDGDRAFVVTFRQIDPLFYIDLSNPTAPEIKGELEVPGFSSYLQVIGHDYLLAVGRNTDEFATKVALYNVADPAHPTLVDEETLPRWSWSIAEYDHHAFGYYDEHGILAIPVSGYDDESFSYRSELVVFDIDTTQTGDAAVELKSTVTDNGTVLRSAFIDDVLYSISTTMITATSVTDPSMIAAEFDLERESEFFEFDFEPIFTEDDDGAADWEYLNIAESRADNELLTALGAVNSLDGQVRVSLLHSFATTDVLLADGVLTVASADFETQTFAVSEATSIVVAGTEQRDVVSLDLNAADGLVATSVLVLGGDGNDALTVNRLAKTLSTITLISGDAGHDRLIVDASVTTGARLSGGDGRDVLIGSSGNDWLHGGAGNDWLDGGRGNDQLFGSSGRDQLFGRPGNDLLLGGTGHDLIVGGAGRDLADGGAGNDTLRGGTGSDALRGGDGDDVIRGDDGNDTLQGDAGHDRIFGGRGHDAISGGSGHDIIFGDADDDTLLGGDGNDVLRGGTGLDVVLGEAGDDFVSGEQSIGDTVSGGDGNDIVRTRSTEIDESFTFSREWLDAVFGLLRS